MRGFGLTFDGVDRFSDDAVARPRRRHDLALGLHQPQRQLGTLARHLHQHHDETADDQGRVRRTVGHRHDRRQLERDRHHVQRRRRGHAGGRVGRVRDAAGGHDARRRSAGRRSSAPPSPFRGRDDLRRQLALRHASTTPLVYSGHERNFQAYVNTLTLPPGKSRSLLHFIVLGQRVDATTSAGERAAVEATADQPGGAPDIGDLTTAEICSIAQLRHRRAVDPRLRLRRLRRRGGSARGRAGAGAERRRRARPPSSTTWSRRRSASCAPTWKRAS